MTTRTKWLIAGAVALAGMLGVGALVIGFFFMGGTPARLRPLPVYSIDQTDSSHPWYRRSTVRFKSAVYVNDFEDYPIWLAYPVPTEAIGRSSFGGSLLCAIPGQASADYIAVDVGSEMEAYQVFRNVNHPPFDWRHATFQTMEFAGTMIHVERKTTTDTTLIADVVRTLREGAPVPLSLPDSVDPTNVATVHLSSDQLSGLVFCPTVYRDTTGAVYLAESYGVEYGNRMQKIHADWIPASESFTQWLKGP